MPKRPPDRPHFAWPFGLDATTKKVAVVEQRTTEHIQGQQYAVAVTPLGYREDRPDFGWPWPEFQNIPIDTSALEQAIRRFVPDSDHELSEWGDIADQALRHIRIAEREG